MAASWLWISLTLGAAAMQTVRTAGQKRLSEDISALMATLTRFLFGLPFALASLSLRRASLSLGDPNFLATSALTLFTVIAIETALLGVIIVVRDREQFTAMRGKLKISTFIGATSMLGSVGWFTAMTLEQASYVRAFGQIEFVFAMLVSTRLFRERYTRKELVGIALIAASSVALVFF